MSKGAKLGVVIAVSVVVGAVIVAKTRKGDHGPSEQPQSPPTSMEASPPTPNVPRLVDIGSGVCIPCKMMAPILEELRREYAGRLSVEFYDVREDPEVGQKYGIRMIPTQIFYDATGKERHRHEGFMSKEDILSKWKELGVSLDPPAVERGERPAR